LERLCLGIQSTHRQSEDGIDQDFTIIEGIGGSRTPFTHIPQPRYTFRVQSHCVLPKTLRARRYMTCDACDVEMIAVQTRMDFRALPAGQDWVEFPILANVCPNCGKLDLNVAAPAQFAQLMPG